MRKPENELNNQFLTLAVSRDIKELVERLRWQLRISRSRLVREALVFYVQNKLEGVQNENKGEK